MAIMFNQLLLNHVGKFGKPSLSYIKEAVIEWFRHVIDTKNWDNEIVDIEKLFILNYEDHFKGILNNLLISYEKSLKDKQIQLVKTQEYFDEQYHLPLYLVS